MQRGTSETLLTWRARALVQNSVELRNLLFASFVANSAKLKAKVH
jgi:hypothetical protein